MSVKNALLSYRRTDTPPTLLRYDDFNRSDGALAGSTPSDGGSAWVAALTGGSNSWAVSSNTASASGTNRPGVYLEASTPDVLVEATVQQATYGGLMARYASSGPGNYSFWYFVLFGSGASIQLYRWTNSGYTEYDSSTGHAAISAGDVLSLRCVGDQINCYVNGVKVIGPITDASLTANTKHGLQAPNTSTTGLDNFKVYSAS